MMNFWRHNWFQILVSGLVLLYAIQRVLIATKNINFVPSLILLGSFLIPVVYVTYLYEKLPNWDFAFAPIATCFLWGGVVGTLVAGSIEYATLRSMGLGTLFGVGAIEEAAKLIFPIGFYLIGRNRSEANGIVLGTACAMGFAALETMGYSFTALLRYRNIAALDTVLFARGLFAPAGHAAWTGLVCAVLWRERVLAGRAVINRKVVAAFITAVVLHTAWDTFQLLQGSTLISAIGLELMSLLVALTSLHLLNLRVRESIHQPLK